MNRPTSADNGAAPHRTPTVLEAAHALTETLIRPPSWHRRAACRSTTVDHYSGDADELEAARANCARCAVVIECLEHALAVPEAFGVWAGMTPSERRRLAREAVA